MSLSQLPLSGWILGWLLSNKVLQMPRGLRAILKSHSSFSCSTPCALHIADCRDLPHDQKGPPPERHRFAKTQDLCGGEAHCTRPRFDQGSLAIASFDIEQKVEVPEADEGPVARLAGAQIPISLWDASNAFHTSRWRNMPAVHYIRPSRG